MAAREREADEFYAELTPAGASTDEALVLRQAFAGMLWSKQFYHYDVERWLDGDPARPPPPDAPAAGATTSGAPQQRRRHLDARHVGVPVVRRVGPRLPLRRARPRRPGVRQGAAAPALPRVVHAPQRPAARVRVGRSATSTRRCTRGRRCGSSRSTARGDYEFLERIFHKLLLNFTWWVNRKDAEGNNVFEGGFLGLDNIGPFDRSRRCPSGGALEQSDGTAWMAMYCLNMLEIALVLAEHDAAYEDMATKFFEHFALHRRRRSTSQGLWDEEDGFYYDVLPRRRRALPAAGAVDGRPAAARRRDDARRRRRCERLPDFAARAASGSCATARVRRAVVQHRTSRRAPRRRLLSIVDRSGCARILARDARRDEFLSPYGVRSLSAVPPRAPVRARARRRRDDASTTSRRSRRTALFGGNSNWRGPVWFPVNYLLIEALRVYHRYFGDDFTVEFPTGSGQQLHARRRSPTSSPARLIAHVPPRRATGAGRCFGGYELLQRDPALARPDPVPRVLPRRHRRRASAPRTRPAGPASSPT